MNRALKSSAIYVGIIGSGFGRYGLAPAFRRDPRCRIVSVAALSRKSTSLMVKELGDVSASSVDDMIADPAIDAIAIAIPPAEQVKIASRALESGKAVFAEKPISTSAADALNLSDLADSIGLANGVDFMFPELDTWRQAKTILSEDTLGPLSHMFLDWRMESYDNRVGLKGWKTNRELGGGVLAHFGSHSLYYLEWLFGPLVELGARLSTAEGLATTGDTLACLNLWFDSGLTGTATFSNVAPFAAGHRLEVYGKAGALHLANPGVDPIEGFELSLGMLGQDTREVIISEPNPDGPDGEDSRVRPVSRLVSRFLDGIEGKKPTLPTFRDGARVQVLIEAAMISDREGIRMDVAL